MNCYMCDNAGSEVEAVAVCQHCGAALCRGHLDQDLLARRPMGHHRRGCTHALLRAAHRRQDAREFAGSFIFDDDPEGGFGSVP